MGNMFDKVRDQAFDAITKTFGKTASWTPSAGGPAQIVQIGFNDPDAVQKLGDIEFLPARETMEYRIPFFPGLKESADSSIDETVVIENVNYYVRSVSKIDDGNTLIAIIEKY